MSRIRASVHECFTGDNLSVMAKDCCWNCKYYIVKGDNEPAILSGAASNVCVFSDTDDDGRNWLEKACPTPPNYVCRFYRERFY